MCRSGGQARPPNQTGWSEEKTAESERHCVTLREKTRINAKLCFAAADLGRLPPIGFDSINVCTLLAQLQATMADLEGVKANVAAQAITYSELQNTVAMQGGLCTNQSNTVSAIVAKSVAAVGETKSTSATSTRPDLPVVSAVTAVPVELVRAAPPQPTTRKVLGLRMDGASVMESDINGVNGLLTKNKPQLVFIHCVCHRLNLAASQVCTGIEDMAALQTVLGAPCRRPVQASRTWRLSRQCWQLSSATGLYRH